MRFADFMTIDHDSQTPLHVTLCSDIAHRLIDGATDVNVLFRYGNTHLKQATLFGDRYQLLTLILDHGIDVNKADPKVRVSLHHATLIAYLKVSEVF